MPRLNRLLFSHACLARLAAAALMAVAVAFGASLRKTGPMADYLAAGGPPTNAAWTAQDYVTLKRLVKEHAISLPRIGAPMGAVLERMTNPENFVEIVTSEAPIMERLQKLEALSAASRDLQPLYLKEKLTSVEDELTLLFSFHLHMLARSTELHRELERSIKDPAAQQRLQAALNQSAAQAGNIMDSVLTFLVRGMHAPYNRVRLIRGFSELLATRAARLPKARIDDFRERLAPLVQYEENAEVKAEMAKAHEVCVEALKARQEK